LSALTPHSSSTLYKQNNNNKINITNKYLICTLFLFPFSNPKQNQTQIFTSLLQSCLLSPPFLPECDCLGKIREREKRDGVGEDQGVRQGVHGWGGGDDGGVRKRLQRHSQAEFGQRRFICCQKLRERFLHWKKTERTLCQAFLQIELLQRVFARG